MFIVHLHYTDHRVPSTKCRNPKPETRKYVHNMSIFHSLHKSPSLSAKTRNSKPSVQHVHFSFTLHKSSSAECRVPSSESQVPRTEARDPKICMQHFHFSLVAQITEFQVLKPKTRNRVCNMFIVHLYYTDH
jgi:hypothetical protein